MPCVAYRTGAAREVTQIELDAYFVRLVNAIRDARRERDVTQAELSRVTGISEQTLSRLERHAGSSRGTWKHGPRYETIVRIARALGMEPSELT